MTKVVRSQTLQNLLLAIPILEKYTTKDTKLDLVLYDDEYYGLVFQHNDPYTPTYPKISKEDKEILRTLGDFRVNKKKGKYAEAPYEEWELGTWLLWSNAG